MNTRKYAITLLHALVGWALCAASMGIGQAVTSVNNALVIHAIAAPIIFMLVSIVYFKRFGYTHPRLTAIIFVLFVMLMDFFVVAILALRSMDMFASLLGTWIPFALIFASTWITGLYIVGRKKIIIHSAG